MTPVLHATHPHHFFSFRLLLAAAALIAAIPAAAQVNTSPPATTQRLVFIHHSVGYGWLDPGQGGLITELNYNNYFVTDTDYDWGPLDGDVGDGLNVGSHTDIGHWYNWFLGPRRDAYLQALYANSSMDYENLPSVTDPGGENSIVLFKSCFLSAQGITGSPNDPPLAPGAPNPLRGRGTSEEDGTMYTVANIKGLYRDLLSYFASRPDRLFILITTPPSYQGEADDAMPRLRGINTWLVRDLLNGYPLKNVFVFDYSNVLTSNGGNPTTNDIGAAGGAHHRVWNGQIQHQIGSSNYLAYATYDPGSSSWDSHPTGEGHQKGTAEFIPLLNNAYNQWRASTGTERSDAPSLPRAIASIAPNPFSDETVLRLTGHSQATLKVYDLLGREILDLTPQLGEGSTIIRLRRSQFPAAGMYLLSLRASASAETRKLIVR